MGLFSLLVTALALLCAGCGYRFQDEKLENRSISVPYVVGDINGELTNALIHALSASGRFHCTREGGRFLLKVEVISNDSERLGFRYDRNATSGHLQRNLMPTESRRHVTANVSLVDSYTDQLLLGPFKVEGNADYDFIGTHSLHGLTFVNSAGVPETTLTFSLGQLDSVEGAQDDAVRPLFRSLAQKITEGILHADY